VAGIRGQPVQRYSETFGFRSWQGFVVVVDF